MTSYRARTALRKIKWRSMRILAGHVLKMIAVLLLGGFLGATLVRIAPGYGVDEQELDSRLSHESMQALRAENKTADSLPAYYLRYLRGLMHGNLGFSRTLRQPVGQLIVERFPETLKSVACGLLFAWTFGLSLAIAPVLLRSTAADIFTNTLAGTLLCIPAAIVALLFVIAHAPSRIVIGVVIFPKVYGYASNLIRHQVAQPHVVTAWAKGLGNIPVMCRHILPMAGPQLLAVAGISISLAFASAIPVEVVCDLPGIGQLAWKAALGRDFELLVNLTMVVTFITLFANSVAELAARGVEAKEA
jgi:peptide/nickel transport system permease protein